MTKVMLNTASPSIRKTNRSYGVIRRNCQEINLWRFKNTASSEMYRKPERPVSIWFSGFKSKAIVVGSDKIKIQAGDEKYFLFSELENIAVQINEAKELLSYGDDWDGEGSLATNPVIFNNAIGFLVSYSNYILQHYSKIIFTPYIDISKDGGINIFWDNPAAKFLILFKNSSSKNAFFFAEKSNSKIPFKSAIEINGTIDESIASWMKANLAS